MSEGSQGNSRNICRLFFHADYFNVYNSHSLISIDMCSRPFSRHRCQTDSGLTL